MIYLLQAKDSETGEIHRWTNAARDGTGYPGPNEATELAVVAQHGAEGPGFVIADLPRLETGQPPTIDLVVDGPPSYTIAAHLVLGETYSSSPWQVNSSGSNDIWNAPAVAECSVWMSKNDFAWSLEVEGVFENDDDAYTAVFEAKFILFLDADYLAGAPIGINYTPNDPADNRYVVHVTQRGIDSNGFDSENCLLLNVQNGGEARLSVYTANTLKNIRWHLRCKVSPMGAGTGPV